MWFTISFSTTTYWLVLVVTYRAPRTSRVWRTHILTIIRYLQFANVNIRDSNLYLLSSRRRASKLHYISFSPRWFATHLCTCSTAVVTLRMAYQKSLFANLYPINYIRFLQVSCTLVSCKLQRFFLVPRNRIELLSDAYETPVLTVVLSR